MYYFYVQDFIDSNLNKKLDVHPNTFLANTQRFKTTCMYDEDFAGSYGHEDAYFERLWKFKGGNIVVLDEPTLSDLSELRTTGLNRNGRNNELLRRRKMRYWHIISNPIGKLILASPLTLNLLIKIKLIANGGPTKKIRFQWEECDVLDDK
jgi:hypothetical protein